MSTDDEVSVDTCEAFTEHLQLVLENGYQNDIDIEGGWSIQGSSADLPDWDVEIWRLNGADREE